MDFGMNCASCGLPTTPLTARSVHIRTPIAIDECFAQNTSLVDAPQLSGTVLLCLFCHALHEVNLHNHCHMVEAHPPGENSLETGGSASGEQHPSNFICAVCGIATYRKRVRALPLEKFPFIVNIKQAGSVSYMNGDKVFVAVCLDCSETLWLQSDEYDGKGVSHDERHFDWVVRAPPTEDSGEAKLARLPSGKLVLPRADNDEIWPSMPHTEGQPVCGRHDPSSSQDGDKPPEKKAKIEVESTSGECPPRFMDQPLPLLETESLSSYNLPAFFPTFTNPNYQVGAHSQPNDAVSGTNSPTMD